MNNIKELRISKGLKQSDLAMAELFDVSADYLLGQSDVKKKEKPVVKDDGLNQKLERLSDRNLQRLEEYIDLLLETQGK